VFGGGATISFAIPPTDPGYDSSTGSFVIQPQSGLSAITSSSIILDGRTQTTFGGDTNPYGPEIVLDGSQAAGADGLVITSDDNEVLNLNIRRFLGNGIQIAGGGNTVAGVLYRYGRHGHGTRGERIRRRHRRRFPQRDRRGGRSRPQRDLGQSSGRHLLVGPCGK